MKIDVFLYQQRTKARVEKNQLLELLLELVDDEKGLTGEKDLKLILEKVNLKEDIIKVIDILLSEYHENYFKYNCD